MNLEFKEQVWKAQFKATDESAAFEDKLRNDFDFNTAMGGVGLEPSMRLTSEEPAGMNIEII